ncbi:hypothetical protein EOL99_04515 [Candidatus Falkowbacteria bacterium]|nr:hypothetical protein [Candidatus Falkowbacteria bacterium]
MKNFKGILNPFYGKKHTDITKNKISNANKGRTPWNKGIKHEAIIGDKNPAKRPEVRAKLKNRIITEETRAKLRLVSKGIMRSDEFKLKVSNSKMGVPNPKVAGEKSNFWKGGISKENQKVKNSLDYAQFIRQVYLRDKYTCIKCKQVGGKLNVHHIENFSQVVEKRTCISNGITMCLKCHRKFHKKYGYQNNNNLQMQEYLIN